MTPLQELVLLALDGEDMELVVGDRKIIKGLGFDNFTIGVDISDAELDELFDLGYIKLSHRVQFDRFTHIDATEIGKRKVEEIFD